MKSTAAMDGDYPRTGQSTHAPRADVQTLEISYRLACPLNLPRTPATNADGSCVPVYLSAGGVVPPAPRCRWSV
jgi:hypothetical protein